MAHALKVVVREFRRRPLALFSLCLLKMSCASIVTLSLNVLLLPLACRSESFVGFDAAFASSAYSTGFSADQALTAGTGYWLRWRSRLFFIA